ncbi:Vacuolar amino acid transporter 4 [Seminavis robusta]|uniref:Vacuolar amino acid transporter 4 n=1 Tax=Seminavis robusta TaxID=568900 RepID=A0A9N8HX35_9STRA|nr:Vacuolar amino acid transporter 4 [Seminavis robusta]|eukprot:Sro2116_g315180.1 Vacuolar amino acid transporter 4 (697) ;mRNA; r:2175-4351
MSDHDHSHDQGASYVSASAQDNDRVASPEELNNITTSSNLACGGVQVGVSAFQLEGGVSSNSNSSNSNSNGEGQTKRKIKPKRLWKQFAADTLTSARMHSVSVSERTLPVEELEGLEGTGAMDMTMDMNSYVTLPAEGTLDGSSRTFFKSNVNTTCTTGGATGSASLQDTTTNTTTLMAATGAHANDAQGQGPATLQRIDTWASMGSNIASFEELLPEGGSLGAAVFGIIKGTVGPAILYLPRGFQVAGYAVAIPSMVLATVMYIYNAYRLLACWRAEHDREVAIFRHKFQLQQQQQQQAMAEQGKAPTQPTSCTTTTLHHPPVVMLTYPELAKRAFGPNYSILVDIGIASMQYGVCLTYLIFVPHNLDVCAEALLGITIPKEYYLALVLIIEIPLSWIKDIRKLTPTNVVATGLIAYGLFFVLILAFVQGMAPTEDYNAPYARVFQENLANLPAATDSWFLFVGTSFFMMEGSITLIVPLQESVLRAQDREKFPKINQTVTSGIVIFYIFFSIICCAAFGDSIQTALTASLDGMLATTIQLAYSIAVILTFPLQAFPAMEVLKNNILGAAVARTKRSTTATTNGEIHTGSTHESLWAQDHFQRKALSTVVICILGVIAIYAIEYLGNVVSIIGSLFGIPLALVVPPMMHNILVPDSNKTTRWMNNVVTGIGFMAMAASSFATITAWEKGAEEVRR